MKIKHLLAFMALVIVTGCGQKPQYILIQTDFGDIKLQLYDSTPIHRDNMVKLIKEGFYDDLLFHRVISGFMIQGGDPSSKGAPAGQPLGAGGPGYQLDAELGIPHISGALAAARTGAGNPQKRSSGSQFYIVEGGPVSTSMLDSFEKRKGFKYSEKQRADYLAKGGTPQLDNDYTVFGMVVEGMEVVKKIAQVQKDERDRPIEDIKMKIKLL